MELSFIYFDFPFWRAEVGKIALFFKDIDFENRKITREEFQRVKIHGKLDDGTIIPFHQFPCLIVDGMSIAQTAGIARFCGKLSSLPVCSSTHQIPMKVFILRSEILLLGVAN